MIRPIQRCFICNRGAGRTGFNSNQGQHQRSSALPDLGAVSQLSDDVFFTPPTSATIEQNINAAPNNSEVSSMARFKLEEINCASRKTSSQM